MDDLKQNDVLQNTGTEELIVDNLEEVKDEKEVAKFKDFCRDKSYIIIDKKDFAHFVNMLSYHSRLGFDVYTKSFKMDCDALAETGKITFVYNNGTALAMSSLIIKEAKGEWASYILSIDTISKLFSASQGYMFLYEEEGNMYGYVFGGKVFLDTYSVEQDVCSKEYMIEKVGGTVAETKKVSKEFISIMRRLSEVIHTGTRMEERALYFVNEYVYIYSGMVMGRFKGIGVTLTLQDIDVSTLTRFFFDVDSDIKVEDYNIFMKYSSGERMLYMGKRGLSLSDEMKYQSLEKKDSIVASVDKIKTIISFLLNIGNNDGVVNISQEDRSVKLLCFKKAMNYSSAFKIAGTVTGDGISEVRLDMDAMRGFLKIFDGDLSLKTSGNKIYFENEDGGIVIYGNIH